MTDDHFSSYPIPVETTGFEFEIPEGAPTSAVLEFRTFSNPVRLFLTKYQVEQLAAKATEAASKIVI